MNELIKKAEEVMFRVESQLKNVMIVSARQNNKMPLSEISNLLDEFSLLIKESHLSYIDKESKLKSSQNKELEIKNELKKCYEEYDVGIKDNGIKNGCLIAMFYPMLYGVAYFWVFVSLILEKLNLNKIAGLFLLYNYDSSINYCSFFLYLVSTIIVLVFIKRVTKNKPRKNIERINKKIHELEMKLQAEQILINGLQKEVKAAKENYDELCRNNNKVISFQEMLIKKIDEEKKRIMLEEQRKKREEEEEARRLEREREERRLRMEREREEVRRRLERAKEEERRRIEREIAEQKHCLEVEEAAKAFDEAVINTRNSAFEKRDVFADLIEHTMDVIQKTLRTKMNRSFEKEIKCSFTINVLRDRITYIFTDIENKDEDAFSFKEHRKQDLVTIANRYGFAWALMILVENRLREEMPQCTVRGELNKITDQQKWENFAIESYILIECTCPNLDYRTNISMI